MTAPPALETARLRLRAFGEADLDAFAAMCADPEVMRHIGDGQPIDRATAWRAMAMLVGHWTLRGYGMWALELKASGEFAGLAGLFHPAGWPGLELGWRLKRALWGQGLASEGAVAARDWAAGRLGVDSLISIIQPANERSIRLAERLGGSFERAAEVNGKAVAIYRIPAPGAGPVSSATRADGA